MSWVGVRCTCGCGRSFGAFYASRDKVTDEARQHGWVLRDRLVTLANGRQVTFFEWRSPHCTEAENVAHRANQMA